MVGRWCSFWDCLFSGAMLVSVRVYIQNSSGKQSPHVQRSPPHQPGHVALDHWKVRRSAIKKLFLLFCTGGLNWRSPLQGFLCWTTIIMTKPGFVGILLSFWVVQPPQGQRTYALPSVCRATRRFCRDVRLPLFKTDSLRQLLYQRLTTSPWSRKTRASPIAAKIWKGNST